LSKFWTNVNAYNRILVLDSVERNLTTIAAIPYSFRKRRVVSLKGGGLDGAITKLVIRDGILRLGYGRVRSNFSGINSIMGRRLMGR
jgi:hypothetical protein